MSDDGWWDDRRILAETIVSENDLINQRLNWALILQGFLFADIALRRAIRAFETLQAQSGGSADVRPGSRFAVAPVLLMPPFFIPIALMAFWSYTIAFDAGLLAAG